MSENSESSRSTIEAVEGLLMDCWRMADSISNLEIEHIAANKNAIVETIEKLERALMRLHREDRLESHDPT